MEYRVFVVLAPIAAIVLLTTGVKILPHRRLVLSRTIIAYLGAVALLLISNTVELLAREPLWTLQASKAFHLFLSLSAVSWFWFAVTYAGWERVVSPGRIALLVVEPLLLIVALHTGLIDSFWREPRFFYGDSFLTFAASSYGWLFWVHGVFVYSLIIMGAIVVVQTALGRPSWYQLQTRLLVIGALMPIVVNLFYVFRLFPWLRKDFTPLAFAFSGLAFYFGIERHWILGRRPLSRSAVLEDVSSAIVVLDERFLLLDWNPAAKTLFGAEKVYQGGSILGSDLGRALLQGVSVDEKSSFERFVPTDGSRRSFDVSVRPIVERNDAHAAMTVTVNESTEWYRLKEERQQMHFRMLEQTRLATLGQLAANVAHEIKNPLTALKSVFAATHRHATTLLGGAVESDTERRRISEDLGETKAVFERAFTRILTVINSLTAQARPYDGEPRVIFDVHEAIDSAIQLTKSAHRKLVSIETDFASLPALDGMPGAIGQVFLNIIVNAVQAIQSEPPKDGTPTIRIVTREYRGGADGARMVECLVLNNGPPIPVEERDRVFEPFFTTKPREEGVGLGLSICRDIVEKRHNGEIAVVDDGDYTGFAVRLPVERA